MAQFEYHGDEPDWCHICGKRTNHLADVWYPYNAENDHGHNAGNYLRVCADCGEDIMIAANG